MSRLDRIYIREQNKNGKWDSLSLNEVSDEQFTNWLGKWLLKMAGDRNEVLNCLDELGIPPAEVTEEAQTILDKAEKKE